LVKEVHALLDVENVARLLNCPVVLISRDPLRIVDSLLHSQGVETILWENEFTYFQNSDVLVHYFPDRAQDIQNAADCIKTYPDKERTILKKIFCACMLRSMFRTVSIRLENVKYVEYEDLCSDPIGMVSKVAEFFNFEFKASILPFLCETLNDKGQEHDPYSVFRNTSQQLGKAYKFLSKSEIVLARNLIEQLC
jgi:hypothetical protein